MRTQAWTSRRGGQHRFLNRCDGGPGGWGEQFGGWAGLPAIGVSDVQGALATG
jgi:hypothetical protein